MLAYSVDELAFLGIDNIKLEDIDGFDDLLSNIMKKAVDFIVENDLMNGYSKISVSSNRIKGRIDIDKTIRSGRDNVGEIVCSFFEFNIDNYYNQIIKKVARLLNNYGNINNNSRAILTSIDETFIGVRDISLEDIDFVSIDYDELSYWYKPAIVASKIVMENLIGMDEDGEDLLYNLEDEDRLWRIFEKFTRNLYIEEFTGGKTTAPIYKTGFRENRLDILIECKDHAIVVDTKWYNSKNKSSNRVNNEREVLDYLVSYVENERTNGREITRKLVGVVLYAQTDVKLEWINRIQNRCIEEVNFIIKEDTINLNQNFECIKKDLLMMIDAIIK